MKVKLYIRGGARDYDDWLARCAYRHGGAPGYRDHGVGFRIVSPSFSGKIKNEKKTSRHN